MREYNKFTEEPGSLVTHASHQDATMSVIKACLKGLQGMVEDKVFLRNKTYIQYSVDQLIGIVADLESTLTNSLATELEEWVRNELNPMLAKIQAEG